MLTGPGSDEDLTQPPKWSEEPGAKPLEDTRSWTGLSCVWRLSPASLGQYVVLLANVTLTLLLCIWPSVQVDADLFRKLQQDWGQHVSSVILYVELQTDAPLYKVSRWDFLLLSSGLASFSVTPTDSPSERRQGFLRGGVSSQSEGWIYDWE